MSKSNRQSIEDRKKYQEQVFANLKEQLDEYCSNESAYKQALADLGRFDNYSAKNRMLLSSQMKERGIHRHAPSFKTFNDWKNDDVNIKKGAKAFSIIVPSEQKLYQDNDGVWKKINKNNSQYVKDNNFEQRKVTYFNLKSCMFHISDTNSTLKIVDEGSNNWFTLQKDDEEKFKAIYEASVKAMSKEYNIEEDLNYDVTRGGTASVSTITNDVTITINGNMSSAAKLSVLYHEVAHVELAHHDKNINLSHQQKELEAESTAFLFASKHGVNTDISIDYLDYHIKNGGEIDKVFNRIFKAKEVIEEKFNSLIVENINERDVNMNQVADINEEHLFQTDDQMELLW